jgi:hypothetical protein
MLNLMTGLGSLGVHLGGWRHPRSWTDTSMNLQHNIEAAKIVDLLIPELQRRGLFRTEYTGKTLRENVGLPTPRNPYFTPERDLTAVSA